MSTIAQTMTHARAFLKVGSNYASAEEVRLANTVNDLICSFYRWHWMATAGQDVSLTSPTQDYTINVADRDKVLAIQNAYLTDATTTYGELVVGSDRVLPLTATTGRPTAACLISPTQVRVWRAPDGTYTFKWRYHKRATVYAANTETWDVPNAFDAVAKIGMIWQLLLYQDHTLAPEYEKQFWAALKERAQAERLGTGRIR